MPPLTKVAAAARTTSQTSPPFISSVVAPRAYIQRALDRIPCASHIGDGNNMNTRRSQRKIGEAFLTGYVEGRLRPTLEKLFCVTELLWKPALLSTAGGPQQHILLYASPPPPREKGLAERKTEKLRKRIVEQYEGRADERESLKEQLARKIELRENEGKSTRLLRLTQRCFLWVNKAERELLDEQVQKLDRKQKVDQAVWEDEQKRAMVRLTREQKEAEERLRQDMVWKR